MGCINSILEDDDGDGRNSMEFHPVSEPSRNPYSSPTTPTPPLQSRRMTGSPPTHLYNPRTHSGPNQTPAQQSFPASQAYPRNGTPPASVAYGKTQTGSEMIPAADATNRIAYSNQTQPSVAIGSSAYYDKAIRPVGNTAGSSIHGPVHSSHLQGPAPIKFPPRSGQSMNIANSSFNNSYQQPPSFTKPSVYSSPPISQQSISTKPSVYSSPLISQQSISSTKPPVHSDPLASQQPVNRQILDTDHNHSLQDIGSKLSVKQNLEVKGSSTPNLGSLGKNGSNVLVNLESLLEELRATQTRSSLKPRMDQVTEMDVFEEEWVVDQSPANSPLPTQSSPEPSSFSNQTFRRNRVISCYGELADAVDIQDGAALAKATLVNKMQEISQRRKLRQATQSHATHSALHIPRADSPISTVYSTSTPNMPFLEVSLQPPLNSSFDDLYDNAHSPRRDTQISQSVEGHESNSSAGTMVKSPSDDMNHFGDSQTGTIEDSISTLADPSHQDSHLGKELVSNSQATSCSEEMHELQNGSKKSAICAFCEEEIHDRPIFLLGRNWHRDHSRCYECRRPIGVDNFIEIGSFLYCEDHYLKVNNKYVVRRESDRTKQTSVEAELSQIKQHNTVRKVRNLFTFEKAVKVNMLTVMEERTRNGRMQRSVMSWMPKDGEYELELKQLAELNSRPRSVLQSTFEEPFE
ncbi:Transforming growth factor beta-1-induced transcript 1 protein [Batrachochytrium dendrobatidis]|nr:Transforming growth factor beta-1-induced transcript 1 protein [Batrachochytrium dendrobatidis]